MTKQHWFSVGAPGFDTEALQTRIIERMFQRSPQGLLADDGSSEGFERLEKTIAEVWDALDTVSVQVAVRDERLPIGNATWNRIKAQFHALTVLYVNELAGRQSVVNSRMVTTLSTLASYFANEIDQRDQRLQLLEQEVARLREQVEHLSKGQG